MHISGSPHDADSICLVKIAYGARCAIHKRADVESLRKIYELVQGTIWVIMNCVTLHGVMTWEVQVEDKNDAAENPTLLVCRQLHSPGGVPQGILDSNPPQYIKVNEFLCIHKLCKSHTKNKLVYMHRGS